jgi:beta-glucanase (GH16 family)
MCRFTTRAFPLHPELPMLSGPKRRLLLHAIVIGLATTGLSQTNPTPTKAEDWKLVWSDEFNGPDGSPVDRSKWTLETGGWGWGNQELEYYTDRIENASIHDGNLVIKALPEKYTGPDGVTRNFTSARLKTLGKFSQAYGRFEARIKVPYGQGMWPAFWMLGADFDKVGWPACGEIDIMENIGKEPGTIHGSIHGPGYIGGTGIEAPYTLPGKQRFADDYHVFGIEWDPDSVGFYVDQDLYVRRTRADLQPGWKWMFDKPFFLLLNLAVGGDWPGNPDSTTVFPQTMLVDYVRVYERAGRTLPTSPSPAKP